jgi:hypothetical protein
MGIVLILAIIGSMSILDKSKVDDGATNTPQLTNNTKARTPSTITSADIKAPEISIAPQTNDKTIPLKQTIIKANKDNFQPTLEGEQTKAEKLAEETKRQADAIKYGILKLRTINPENQKSLLANYIVFNNKNIKIAESNNTNSASYRLAVGSYKVISTLAKSNNSIERETKPVQSTKTIIINAQKLTNEVFELEPPLTIGILQVSAINAKNKQAMKANFIIQKENGEAVASRKNVTHSLFKLKAGSYKVTVKSGNNSDFRTIVVEPGESATEIFKLQETFSQGKAFIHVLDIANNKPVQADIEISDAKGKIIQALKEVSQTEIALVAGNYKIKVTGSKGVSSKNITIIAGQSSNQTFRIDSPLKTSKIDSVKISDNVRITAVGENTNNKEVAPKTIENDKNISKIEGTLKLFAQNGVDRKPIKSNFYVQTPNGKHLAKKIYANSAEFKLKPGKYRITVRSNNRNNIVRNIQISTNQTLTEVFALQRNNPAATSSKHEKTPKTPPVQPNSAIPNGFLNVSMRPAKRTHFVIANSKGKKIVELTSVPSGNFKLDTGLYTVTAILNGQQRIQNIQVYKDKTTRLNFNASDFPNNIIRKNIPQKGGLRSRIIDSNGRPLRGNLTVTNLRGQIVAKANNVTYGEFDLPAVPHTVTVNYQGLSGSEKVKIRAGKITIQTFTISPNSTTKTTATKNARDILRDKVKEELRRIF